MKEGFYMNICFIGASGHYGLVTERIKKDKGLYVSGISPGITDEDMSGLHKNLISEGLSPNLYTDYMYMIDHEKPDVAVINSHFAQNAIIAIEAIKRGCNIFIEKPVAVNLEALDMLINEYQRSGIEFAAMHPYRYDAVFNAAYNEIQKGTIGDIGLITAQKSYKLGSRPEFFKSRKAYGGTIPWVGIHAIDWISWFSNKKFISVYASHSDKLNRSHGELEAYALCQFRLEGNVLASANIDYLRPDKAQGHGDDRLRIAGEKGIIEITGNKAFIMTDDQNVCELAPVYSQSTLFDDFISQIKGISKCRVSAKGSFLLTEAAIRARMSADENRSILF